MNEILIASSVPRTELLNYVNSGKLRESDEIERYNECGWYCATGFKNGKVYVRVHAHSEEELEDAITGKTKHFY